MEMEESMSYGNEVIEHDSVSGAGIRWSFLDGDL